MDSMLDHLKNDAQYIFKKIQFIQIVFSDYSGVKLERKLGSS